jgi:spore coat polysaccharide biosynthesis predicted glycosyltransferase SpsG
MADEVHPGFIADRSNISLLRNPENIAEIMARTCLGISNGGTSLIEFTMLGIPTVIFPQSVQEETFIGPFLESGCGILGSVDRYEFADQLTRIWDNTALRKCMAENGRKLIDGLGAERISDAIEKFFFRRVIENEGCSY